ncbi:hypothetical protein LVJ94_48445 [Pendulispora rubella]|uniref:Cytochrome P460 domain-containing protein n=1 Tax=Pendulispora rubella TaxID=2741070 RepID=A0ABZ2L1J4_9BACT
MPRLVNTHAFVFALLPAVVPNCAPYDESPLGSLDDEPRDGGAPRRGSDSGDVSDAAAPGAPGSQEHFAWWFKNLNYRRHPAFAKVTSAPYPSAVAGGSSIEVYVTKSLADTYLGIRPDRTGSNASILPPTVIVREVFGVNGQLTKLTVMAKGLDGYNPDLGDWYFGEFDSRGNVLLDSNGRRRAGRLGDCYACHLPRRDDAYLFGVPDSARAQ